MEQVKKIQILRWKEKEMEDLEDIVVTEYPLTIFINGEEFITLLCSPKGLKYLTLGFLISEGLIKSRMELPVIHIDEIKGHAFVELTGAIDFTRKLYGKRTITTGCGKGSIFYNVLDSLGSNRIVSDVAIRAEKLLEYSRWLNEKSSLFLDTGGAHSCALFDGSGVLLFHEDVGRHNALDKIIGEAYFSEIPLEDKILVTSGRISSEMIIKAIKNRIPIIVSRSAPTDLSVSMASQFNVTLVGFARGHRMNVYHGHERII